MTQAPTPNQTKPTQLTLSQPTFGQPTPGQRKWFGVMGVVMVLWMLLLLTQYFLTVWPNRASAHQPAMPPAPGQMPFNMK